MARPNSNKAHLLNHPREAYVVLSQNAEVTDYYMNVIKEALERSGWTCQTVEFSSRTTFPPLRKGALIVVASCMDALRFIKRGFENVVVWCQGIVPEESFMRRHSRTRRFALSLIESYVLKKAEFVFFVSSEMKSHYEAKYGLDFEGRYGIMPCFNSELCAESVLAPGKYASKVFVYMGSLAAWQCFDDTAHLFRRIEERMPDALFKVYCFDQRGAEEKLRRAGVQNYWVGSVPPDQVPVELRDASFGFVIREDCAVNRVATPTKLSSYLSAGVIPIFSRCLTSFREATKGMKYALPVDAEPDVDAVIDFCSQPIEASEALAEFEHLFETYYSREHYVESFSSAFEKRFANSEVLDR